MEPIGPKLEHVALEQDIERLASEIKDRKIANQHEQKRVIKESLNQYVQHFASSKSTDNIQSRVLPSYLADAPIDIKYQVEKLLDLAWHQGVVVAFKEARKASPLILDAFHDAITDKIYEELKKRGEVQ